MSKEIKYPYIGEGLGSGSVVVFYEAGAGTTLDSKTWASKDMEHHNTLDESRFKNITREYLQNTWGVVESKEHAEFISELGKNASAKTSTSWEGGKRFNFYTNSKGGLHLDFYDEHLSKDSGEKQITIPLPPKAKLNFSDLPKHFDCRCNKCGGKCCAGFCDTWPKVGDEVVITDQHNKLEGELLALTKEYAIISQPHGEQHLHLSGWSFEKPKSAQEIKIEELQTKLCENNAVDNYILACDIVVGNIKGVSYGNVN